MEHSYRFFQNKDCKYYPCHEGIEAINCLFCYCPLYHMESCPGNKGYVEIGDRRVKVCTNCTLPHKVENYEAIIKILGDNNTPISE